MRYYFFIFDFERTLLFDGRFIKKEKRKKKKHRRKEGLKTWLESLYRES